MRERRKVQGSSARRNCTKEVNKNRYFVSMLMPVFTGLNQVDSLFSLHHISLAAR